MFLEQKITCPSNSLNNSQSQVLKTQFCQKILILILCVVSKNLSVEFNHTRDDCNFEALKIQFVQNGTLELVIVNFGMSMWWKSIQFKVRRDYSIQIGK